MIQEFEHPEKILYYIIQTEVYIDIFQLLINGQGMSITNYLETKEVPPHTSTGLVVLREMLTSECNFIEAMSNLEMDLSNPVNIHIGFAVEELSRKFTIPFTP